MMNTSAATGSAVDPRQFKSFAEFYPFYLSEHANLTCRRLHFAGSTLSLLCLVALVLTLNPLWLLAGLVVVLAIGGPGSMIGFDFARTFNPAHRIGTATGIVNVGGFIASLVAIYLIGLVLDVLYATGFSQGELYGLDPFRIALSVQFLLLAGGAGGIIVIRRKVRKQMAVQGVVVPPLLASLAEQRRLSAERRRTP